MIVHNHHIVCIINKKINKKKMIERKKLDVTNIIYILLMVVVFMLGLNSCAAYRYKKNKEVIPAAKYQKYMCCKSDTTSWNGLKISDYESQGGFNYLEDIIKISKKK